MTAAEHLAEVKWMTPEEVDAIERRMLQDMARRYGILQDAEKQRREGAKANAYRRARKATEEKSA